MPRPRPHGTSRTRLNHDQDTDKAEQQADEAGGSEPLAEKKSRTECDEERHGEGNCRGGRKRYLRDGHESSNKRKQLDDGPQRVDTEIHRAITCELATSHQDIERDQTGKIAEEHDADRMDVAGDNADNDTIHRRDDGVQNMNRGPRSPPAAGPPHAASAAVCHFGFGVAFMSCRVYSCCGCGDLVRRRMLDDFAALHDDDPIGEMTNDRQVHG